MEKRNDHGFIPHGGTLTFACYNSICLKCPRGRVAVYRERKKNQLARPGPLARSDACPPGNQTFTGSIPGPAHSFIEIWL